MKIVKVCQTRHFEYSDAECPFCTSQASPTDIHIEPMINRTKWWLRRRSNSMWVLEFLLWLSWSWLDESPDRWGHKYWRTVECWYSSSHLVTWSRFRIEFQPVCTSNLETWKHSDITKIGRIQSTPLPCRRPADLDSLCGEMHVPKLQSLGSFLSSSRLPVVGVGGRAVWQQ